MKNSYVLGIGAANVDIYGKSDIKIRQHYDHPANISSSPGGVTRNILANYVKLGGHSKIISAIGDDLFGKMILEGFKKNHIDTEDIMIVEDGKSGVFMQVMDEDNDMYLALCDMSILKNLTPDYLVCKEGVILNSQLVICDPSLDDEVLEELFRICEGRVKIFADPISDNYAEKLSRYVPYFSCLKPNRKELEYLSGIETDDDEGINRATLSLLEKGVQKVFVSLGKDGLLYMDRQGNKIRKKLKPVENMINASGAGDAMMAAIIYGEVEGLDVEKTVDYGLAAGKAAILSKETLNQEMSVELLNKICREDR